MKKIYFVLVCLWIANTSFAQDFFVFSPLKLHFQTENPEIFKINKVVQVIQREYLSSDNGKLHLIINHYYNDGGYLIKKESGKSYPINSQPDSMELVSYQLYKYEMIDSFIYQKVQIIRLYEHSNTKLEKPDTLPTHISNFYNPYNLEIQRSVEGAIFGKYEYDKNGNLLAVDVMKKQFDIKYKKDVKKSMKTVEPKIPNLPIPQYDKKYQYIFDKNKILVELIEINGSQEITYKYEYNDKGLLTKEKMYLGSRPTPIVYTYEYIFN
jgi:hypothetical protein